MWDRDIGWILLGCGMAIDRYWIDDIGMLDWGWMILGRIALGG